MVYIYSISVVIFWFTLISVLQQNVCKVYVNESLNSKVNQPTYFEIFLTVKVELILSDSSTGMFGKIKPDPENPHQAYGFHHDYLNEDEVEEQS